MTAAWQPVVVPSSFWQMGQIGGPSIWLHWAARFWLYIKSVRQSMTYFSSPRLTFAFFQTELCLSCVRSLEWLQLLQLLDLHVRWCWLYLRLFVLGNGIRLSKGGIHLILCLALLHVFKPAISVGPVPPILYFTTLLIRVGLQLCWVASAELWGQFWIFV